MLNNYYFNDKSSINVGDKSFQRKFKEYLSGSYNYTLEGIKKDASLSDEDLKKLYKEGMCPLEYADLIMDEIGFRKSNYFNIILSDQHDEVIEVLP